MTQDGYAETDQCRSVHSGRSHANPAWVKSQGVNPIHDLQADQHEREWTQRVESEAGGEVAVRHRAERTRHAAQGAPDAQYLMKPAVKRPVIPKKRDPLGIRTQHKGGRENADTCGQDERMEDLLTGARVSRQAGLKAP